MKRILLIFLSLLGFMAHAQTVRVAVAANMHDAMQALKHRFAEIHPEIQLITTLNGTGTLISQIRHGAPYDVLVAADMQYAEALHAEGLTRDRPRVYAKGALALLSTHTQDFSKGLNLLNETDIHTIVIANPKLAPYGEASIEALKSAGLLEKLKSKLIYSHSVSQATAQTVAAADIGIVALSALYSPQMHRYKEGEHWQKIDTRLYAPIRQGIVLLCTSKRCDDANLFYDFMLSALAAPILERYGYALP